jgi:hypothetical protein
MGKGLCRVVDSVDKCRKLCRTLKMFHVEHGRRGVGLSVGAIPETRSKEKESRWLAEKVEGCGRRERCGGPSLRSG